MKARNTVYYSTRETETHYEFHVSKEKADCENFQALSTRHRKEKMSKVEFEKAVDASVRAYGLVPVVTVISHTPLPWKIKSNNYDVYDADRNLVCETDLTSNAEFIVRACNSHYELLNACIDAEAQLTAHGHDDSIPATNCPLCKLRKAIRSAQGKEITNETH